MSARRAARAGSQRSPFPEWASYAHSIWIYDTTRFAGCRNTWVVLIMDLVTRKWICEIVSAEQTSLVQLAFTIALELEGLLDAVDALPAAPLLPPTASCATNAASPPAS